MIQDTHGAKQGDRVFSETFSPESAAQEAARSVGFSTGEVAALRRFFELLDAWDKQVSDNE